MSQSLARFGENERVVRSLSWLGKLAAEGGVHPDELRTCTVAAVGLLVSMNPTQVPQTLAAFGRMAAGGLEDDGGRAGGGPRCGASPYGRGVEVVGLDEAD